MENTIFVVLFIIVIGTTLVLVANQPISTSSIFPEYNVSLSNLTEKIPPIKTPETVQKNITEKWLINPKYCERNEDCTITTLSCCPCNMGGKPKCVNKYYAEEFRKNLSCNKGMVVCPAVYYCDQINSCICVNNTCVPT